MKNQKLLLILVPVALVLLCCIGLLLAGLDDIVLRAVSVLATSTPIPTDTLTPTLASTPTPTVAPAPTDTPTPEPTAGPPRRVQQYSLEIARKGEVLTQTLKALGALLQSPQLTDRGWKREVAAHVATIDRIHQELKDMEVPVEMIGVHSALLDAMFDCDGVTYFLKDVDNISLSDASVASRLAVACNEKFSRRVPTPEE